jgi:hydrogenase maturation protease
MMIVGIGNRFRGDDGAGLVAARDLRERLPDVRVLERDGNLAGMLDEWEGEDAVVLIDATSSGSAAGTIRRFDAEHAPLPSAFSRGSTHLFGVSEAIELGRVLGRLPKRLVVYGIEGSNFSAGEGLSREVSLAVDSVIRDIRREFDPHA